MPAPGSPCGSTRIRHKLDGLPLTLIPRQTGSPIVALVADDGCRASRHLMPDSNSEPDFLAVAAKRGAARCLPKPFKPPALLAAVADCLAAATNPSAPDSDVAARR